MPRRRFLGLMRGPLPAPSLPLFPKHLTCLLGEETLGRESGVMPGLKSGLMLSKKSALIPALKPDLIPGWKSGLILSKKSGLTPGRLALLTPWNGKISGLARSRP